MTNKCDFSPCRKYRYTLWRQWELPPKPICRDCADSDGTCPNSGKPCDPSSYVQFIGLNPSTADETKDDPTIRRCLGYAKSWGFNAMCMTNLFAFRATDPKSMKAQDFPEGLDNDSHLLKIGSGAALIIAAWGNNGIFRMRDLIVTDTLRRAGLKLHCLGKSKDGYPKHPLYLKKDLKPIAFS